jgi:hypothetical protein
MATVSVSVTVDRRELERLIRAAPSAAGRTMQASAVRLRKEIQRIMPRKTGDTARDTREVRKGPYDWAVAIPEVPGRFLIEGTQPHTIVPSARKRLRFTTGGGVVFARVVHHPGTKAYPFAQDAARAELPRVTAAVVADWRRRAGGN